MITEQVQSAKRGDCLDNDIDGPNKPDIMSNFNYQKFYDQDYYVNMVPGIPYDRVADGGHWLRFFSAVVDKLLQYLSPQSVLDIGCAKGFLVEAFHNRGILSYGFDYSEFAVASVREDLKSLVFTGSAADINSFRKFQDYYDLITCIEVVEHMPRKEAVNAIENMCQHSKTIFFSSTADDFAEPTHLTVLPRVEWLKIFSSHGFYPDYDFDVYDLIPHSILLRKIEDKTLYINNLVKHSELYFDNFNSSKLRIENLLSETANLERKVDLERSALELSQLQLQQVKSALELSQLQLQQVKSALELSQLQLQQAKSALGLLESHISWVETSKFWKFRTLFMTLKQGVNVFLTRVFRLLPHQMTGFSKKISFAEPPEYAQWITDYEPTEKELEQQNKQSLTFQYQPLLSIVLPIYKLPLCILQETIESVLKQTYTNWELCIAFANDDIPTIDYLKDLSSKDNRIKLNIMPENLGISGNSNISLKMASGEFVVLLDHDDLLPHSAFYEVANKLNNQPDLDFIYSDKDCISADSMVRSRLLLKPEWSPELLYSANYLTHLCVARRELVELIGGFRSETDGAQDWDIFLRISEQTSRIARLTSVLYHWRIIQGSTSLGIDSKPYALEAQLRSIQNHLSRTKLPAKVSPHPKCGFRLEWKVPPARVSIIIDGNVSWADLSTCVSAVAAFANPSLHRVKIVIPESNYHSHASQRESLLETINLSVDWLLFGNTNSSLATLAEAAKQDLTDVVLFVSGQVMKFQQGWIEELSGWVLGHPEIGFASALVLTDKNLVVEAGLVIDKYGNGSPLLRGENVLSWEMFGGALWYRNCTASSPWSIAFSYQHYQEIGGLPTDSSSVLQSMIKLCQASRASNKRGLSNPHALVYLADLPSNDIPKFDESLADDPYFHPAFASVVPLKLKTRNGDK
jgi:2-polyprenyl-3-methyl-5-hydroxy-6-metoxy-1,4-benzoquinol methylase